jgi:hypothetical protein
MHLDKRLLTGVLCLVCSPGCTLIGAGIGAGISLGRAPEYEERAVEKVHPGDRVSISASAGRHLVGRYAGAVAPTPLDPRLVLMVDGDDNGKLMPVPTNEIESMKVDAADRKWWLYGGVIGALVDAMVLGALAYYGNGIDM